MPPLKGKECVSILRGGYFYTKQGGTAGDLHLSLDEKSEWRVFFILFLIKILILKGDYYEKIS